MRKVTDNLLKNLIKTNTIVTKNIEIMEQRLSKVEEQIDTILTWINIGGSLK